MALKQSRFTGPLILSKQKLHLNYILSDFLDSRNIITSSNGNIFHVTGPLCGEFPGPGEFPAQRPVMRSFDVFFDLRLNKRLSRQPRGWWFETPSWSLWRQCNEQTCSLESSGKREFCLLNKASSFVICLKTDQLRTVFLVTYTETKYRVLKISDDICLGWIIVRHSDMDLPYSKNNMN